MRGIWEHFCALCLGIILGSGLLALLIPSVRQWPASVLVRRDQVKQADAIVILMGGVVDRTPYCAELLKKGFAPKIVWSEAEKDALHSLGFKESDGQATYLWLQKLGVKEEQMLFQKTTEVTSTAEEMRANYSWIKKQLPQAKHLIICTSWFHSSRAFWISEQVNENKFRLSSMPSPQPQSWYAQEVDFLSVFNEYLKWIYYFVRYDLNQRLGQRN